MDDMKEIINRIMKNIKERKENIKLPSLPERCFSCYDGSFSVDNLGFNCEFYGFDDCLILKEFITEKIGKIFTSSKIELVEKDVRGLLEEYLKNIWKMKKEGIGLSIFGSIGVGKTSIISLIIKELFRKRYSFDYFHSGDLFLNISPDFKGHTFLFIDDLGAELKSEYTKAYFDTLIDFRYRNKLVTIFTTNLSIQELKNLYPRSCDRLFSKNIKIILTGRSRRNG